MLNRINGRLFDGIKRASLPDYRRCYNIADSKTREEHVVGCDENGVVTDNPRLLKLHVGGTNYSQFG